MWEHLRRAVLVLGLVLLYAFSYAHHYVAGIVAAAFCLAASVVFRRLHDGAEGKKEVPRGP